MPRDISATRGAMAPRSASESAAKLASTCEAPRTSSVSCSLVPSPDARAAASSRSAWRAPAPCAAAESAASKASNRAARVAGGWRRSSSMVSTTRQSKYPTRTASESPAGSTWMESAKVRDTAGKSRSQKAREAGERRGGGLGGRARRRATGFVMASLVPKSHHDGARNRVRTRLRGEHLARSRVAHGPRIRATRERRARHARAPRDGLDAACAGSGAGHGGHASVARA